MLGLGTVEMEIGRAAGRVTADSSSSTQTVVTFLQRTMQHHIDYSGLNLNRAFFTLSSTLNFFLSVLWGKTECL